jgi:hypothetical protein
MPKSPTQLQAEIDEYLGRVWARPRQGKVGKMDPSERRLLKYRDVPQTEIGTSVAKQRYWHKRNRLVDRVLASRGDKAAYARALYALQIFDETHGGAPIL